jgi:trans-2,3-dihydro-3-hydroxyanthranilate isomerase
MVDYQVVDVFTDAAFAGNPLAVVLDADDLETHEMQSIAREFNLSETTFVVTPTSPDASYRVRIFTPSSELPFAGHPSIGTAWVLHRLGRIAAGNVVQECGAGNLTLEIRDDVVELSGGKPSFGDELAVDDFCAAVGVPLDAAVGTPVRWCGTGLDFAFLHVDESAVRHAAPDLTRLEAIGGAGVSVFAIDDARSRVHARVFAGGVGVPEDPATGSAALGLGVFLVASGLLPGDGTAEYVIEQGA